MEDICAIYRDVFSQPPYFWRADESELHRQRLERLLEDPSFAVTLAFDGDHPIGFAYGFSSAPDTARWSLLSEPLPDDVTAEWPGRTFVLFDFAVREQYRGRHIGRALHDTLLGSRPEQRATLSVEPQAVKSKLIYERWGWRKIGQSIGGPTAAAPLFDIYLRDSLDDLRASSLSSPSEVN